MPSCQGDMIKEKRGIAPFLKWAGGKRWLVSRFDHFLPKAFSRYVEPFLGSGSVFFFLQPNAALLADKNAELIETYLAVRKDWRKICVLLEEHQRKHSKQHYYEVRDTIFNSPFLRAARFIYLNRTCWNGLYRVNLRGVFNVPMGTKQKVLLDSDDFESTAKALEYAEIDTADFEESIDRTVRGDFLFADPPYTVQHENNGFIKYNEMLFKWEDQVRLRDSLRRATGRGVKILLTNASHQSILDLYKKDFIITKVLRHSIIAGSSNHRKVSEELIIRSYQ